MHPGACMAHYNNTPSECRRTGSETHPRVALPPPPACRQRPRQQKRDPPHALRTPCHQGDILSACGGLFLFTTPVCLLFLFAWGCSLVVFFVFVSPAGGGFARELYQQPLCARLRRHKLSSSMSSHTPNSCNAFRRSAASASIGSLYRFT